MGCRQTKIRPAVLNQRSSTVVSNVSIDLSPTDNDAFSVTVCQQRQAAINNMTYREAINKWRPSSVEELTSLIQKLSSHGNQIDRAWIIFYWISQNIRYDTDAFFSNKIGMQNSDNVFRSGKAVCEGYASLYAELCNRTGVKCRKVSGYAKGFGFDVRQTKFDKTNHAWNIITLDHDHSYFVESTWGSGHLDSITHQYKQNLVPHYFLCRPEEMIYEHLPEDDQCQLLAHPLTLKQYLMLPNTYPEFFTLDLHIVSPAYSAKVDLVEGKAYGLVRIRTSNNNVELSGTLKDQAGNEIQGGDLVYLDKKDRTLWRCQFAPPKPGKYNIFIYGKENNDQDQSLLNAVVQFAFDIDRLSLPAITYPLTWSHFFDYNLEIIKPMNSRYIDWSSDNKTFYCEILVRSPDNVYVSATMKDSSEDTNVKNGTLINFDYKTKLWQCLFAPSNTGVPFKLTLFAQRSDEDKSQCVTQFDLRPIPRDGLKQCMTFPETFTFNKTKCHLIEPLNGILRSGSTVHFRCRIPGAREVNMTVDGNWIKGDALKPDENDVFDSDIQVGQKEVAIWVKFNDEASSYKGLLKYTVR
jgi:L-rhamnose mutarotase